MLRWQQIYKSRRLMVNTAKNENRKHCIRIAQQNLHHNFNATMASLSEAMDRHIDILLLQDPYLNRVNKTFVLQLSMVKHIVIADQTTRFQACITVLKLNQFVDGQSAVASIEYRGIKLKIGSMYWLPLDNKLDYQKYLHKINDLLNMEGESQSDTSLVSLCDS